MIGFVLAHIPDVKADPTSESITWDGVYFGVGIGAGSFDYDLPGRGRKSKRVRERDCEGISEDEICLDPSDWYKIADWWFEQGYSTGEDEDYDYSKDIHTSNDDWNIFGTVQVGIDRQISQNLVIGAFADYDFYDSGSSFSKPWVENGDDEIGSLSGNVELENVWSLGGRIGVLVTPRFLLYGIGGFTQANLDANLTFVLNDDYGTETLSVNLPDTLRGYFLGAGGEIKLRDNLSFKLEYRYSDFNSVSASASKTFVNYDIHPNGFSTLEHENTYSRAVNAELDAELHSARAVLVFKLGGNDQGTQPLK